MGFNEFISKLFGNKASRDMREIQPWVEKVKAVYPTISAMSNALSLFHVFFSKDMGEKDNTRKADLLEKSSRLHTFH